MFVDCTVLGDLSKHELVCTLETLLVHSYLYFYINMFLVIKFYVLVLAKMMCKYKTGNLEGGRVDRSRDPGCSCLCWVSGGLFTVNHYHLPAARQEVGERERGTDDIT